MGPHATGGGYIGAPLKNTILGSLHKSTPRIRRFFEKSAGFPPADCPAGGKPHLFPKIRDNEGWIYVSFLKNWSKRWVLPF